MKYLLLVYAEESTLVDVPDAECVGFDTEIRESGQCVASEALEPVATAATVRVRNGRASVVDGPRSPRPRSSSPASTWSRPAT